jgi:hypothetical protein
MPSPQLFTLQVDEAPLITTTSIPALTVGTHASLVIGASGFPAPTVSQVGTLPAGMTFTSKTATLAGTPSATSGGTYHVTFTAKNETGITTERVFFLTVNSPPKFTSDNHFTFGLNNPGAFAITTSGMPAATFSLIGGGTLPAGVTLTSGVLTGTPTQTGAFVVTIQASNGVTPAATQVFTLMVVKN